MTEKPRGRPPGQDPVPQELADQVIAWVELGKTLRDFCRQPGMPVPSTISRWCEKDSIFAQRFARAREDGFDRIAEETLLIADTPVVGDITTVETDGDGEVVRRTVKTDDMINHRKLQVETRLKLLAKWDPKRYGERSFADGIPSLDEAKRLLGDLKKIKESNEGADPGATG